MLLNAIQTRLFKEEEILQEYLILISLPSKLSRQITRLKKEFHREFGSYRSAHSVPHISMCSFLLLNNRSTDMLSLFQQRIHSLPAFTLRVNGFGFFEEGKVVYAKVEASDEFSFISRELDRSRREFRIRKNYYSSPTPHITIARQLDPVIFEQAKMAYQDKELSFEFSVEELTILNKDFSNQQYKPFDKIRLKG